MSEAFLPFALPDIDENEINEVVDTMRSGWLTTGPKTRQFEKEFAEFFGDPSLQAIAINSATSGLHLALEAVGIKQGDEVITTTYTFTASGAVIRYLGAHPVLVDVDPVTLNIDPAKVEAAITPRTKAIIPVHIGGLACDMEAILDIAKRHNLKVVEDAAHALPTTYQGKLIGTLESDVTVYSFYATKTLATGEGGMLVTRDPKIAARCKVMRLHGFDRDAFDRYTSTRPAWHYDVIAPGFKYNMTDIAASMGMHQLRKVSRFHQRRQALADRYTEALASLPITPPAHAAEGEKHAWHLYMIRLTKDAPVDRDTFIQKMADKKIGMSVHFIPLHLHPYWRDTYCLTPEQFPVAQTAFEAIASLPLYTKMTDDDQERVIRAVQEILGG